MSFESMKLNDSPRYFTYNFPLLHRIKSLKVYCLVNNNASQCNTDLYNHAANVIDESYEGNPERYNFAYTASDIFLKKLSILRKSNKERIIRFRL